MKNKRLRPPPISGVKLRPVDDLLICSTMFELGIVPIENESFDIRRALEQIPADDARKAKRKFRKLWRKLVKRKLSNNKRSTASDRFGGTGANPNRRQRTARKRLVREHVWCEYIAQMLYDIENPQRK